MNGGGETKAKKHLYTPANQVMMFGSDYKETTCYPINQSLALEFGEWKQKKAKISC